MVEGGLQKALYGRLNEKLVSRHIRMVLGKQRCAPFGDWLYSVFYCVSDLMVSQFTLEVNHTLMSLCLCNEFVFVFLFLQIT